MTSQFGVIERNGKTLLLVRDPRRVELLQAILFKLKELNERLGR